MEKRLISYITAPFKIFGFTFKSIITLVFIASLFLNITMLVWQAGAFAVSAAFAGVTGISSVITGLKDTNDRLLKKNNNLLARNTALVKEKNSFASKYQAKNKKTKTELSKIINRISKRTSYGAARNVASIPAEAISLAGIFVVVGVTGLELKEACETMKDMNKINELIGIDAPPEEGTVCGMEVPTTEEVIQQVISSPRAAWEAMGDWELDLPSWEEWGDKFKSMTKGFRQIWPFLRSLIS